MIYDSLSNFSKYVCVHPCFALVQEYIQQQLPLNPYVGKNDISEGVSVIVSEYLTKEIHQGVIECHQKYIDIQLVLTGSERIGVCHKNECKQFDYSAEKDFQKLEGSAVFLPLQPGYFVIFFPDDGHMPQIIYNTQQKVKKAVFKIPVQPN